VSTLEKAQMTIEAERVTTRSSLWCQSYKTQNDLKLEKQMSFLN